MSTCDNYYKTKLNIDTEIVVIYARLSKEDKNKQFAEESESIQNQKNMLINYALEKNWNIYDIYCDEDFSGIDDTRPEFNRLLADAENKKFNIILCKSQSRFTRDSIYVEKYLHNKFQQWGIRFISVVDSVDTKDKGNKKSRQINGLVNEWYLEDLSDNIRKTFDTKRKMGEFIGAFAPYGYIKNKEDKNKLVIDETASLIVKRIFNMYINGISMEQIKKTFNLENIPCPAKYKEQNTKYKNAMVKYYLWTGETIKRILTNPTYIGHMTQGRQMKVNYKTNKFIKISKEKWIISKNTHEPIIDEKTFNIVQTIIEQKSHYQKYKREDHILSGLLICGDCGQKITYRRELIRKNNTKIFITLCSTYAKRNGCTRHRMALEELNNIVINDMKDISKKAIKDKNRVMSKIEKPKIKQEQCDIEKIIKNKNKRLDDIRKFRKGMLEAKIKQEITEVELKQNLEEYDKEIEKINNEIVILKQEQNNKQKEELNTDFYSLLEQIITFEKIDRSTLFQLIDKIEIFQDKRIKIYYKFAKI